MESLACIPHVELESIEGIVFDIDDTVTRDGRLETPALEAMWALYRAGRTVVAVTGRPLGFCDAIAQMWPVHLAVGENGAGWVHRAGARLEEGYFDPEPVRLEQRRMLDRVASRVAVELPEVRLAGDHRSRRCDLAFDVGESVRLPPATVQRLVTTIEACGARATVSSVHAHAIPGAWDKAKGVVRAAAAVLAIDLADPETRRRFVFVGDSGNDAAAFAFFDLSVGVRNVEAHVAELPVPPRFVTPSDRGLGFAELARAILDARRDGSD